MRESGKLFTFPWVLCPDMIPDISSRQICALTGVHPRDWCTVVAEVALVGGFHLTTDPLGFLVDVGVLLLSIGGGDLFSEAACLGEIQRLVRFYFTQIFRLLRLFVCMTNVNVHSTF